MGLDEFINAIKFDERGLVPVIIQEFKSGEVLMMAYMNAEAIQQTLERGETVFWSRSRQTLWHKGDTSGNVQKVKEIRLDCDNDCVLIKVEQVGGAACHTGYRSCFYRRLNSSQHLVISGEKIFDPDKVYGKKTQ
ncbi:MAG: phosphoribosyl-AMP cyclohydrolase [Candidatus Sumerlaeia bacterium]|nr:phosphoribosyl-AMP cyclohydrolase [Candidatus Sumerlaeia bacterium]